MTAAHALGIKNCHFDWLCGKIADTGRRTLPPGVRRKGRGRRARGGGGYPYAGRRNDQLVASRVTNRGHPILQDTWSRMNQTNNASRQENLDILSNFLGYEALNSPPKRATERAGDPELRPALDAIVWVLTQSPRHELYTFELEAWHYGRLEARVRQRRWCGMFSGRCLRISRKFLERSLDCLRNDLPDYLQIELQDNGVLKCVHVPTTAQPTDDGRIDKSIHTRLHPNNEARLFHPFPKLVLAKLKEALREEDPNSDEIVITERAFDQLNAMFGYNTWGTYNHFSEWQQGGGNLHFEPMLAVAFKEAYVEYFDDTIDEVQWGDYLRTYTQISSSNPNTTARLVARRADREEVRRQQAVRSSVQFVNEQCQRFGHGLFLSIASLSRNEFCQTILNGRGFTQSNIRVRGGQWVRIRETSQLLTPLDAIEQFTGRRIEVYDGITGQANETNRVGKFIADKYYGGRKDDAKTDGWQCSVIFDVLDQDFDLRRFNAGFGEHYCQSYLHDYPQVVAAWNCVEPAPIFGENRSNIPRNTGYIGNYLCIRFVYNDMEDCV